MNTMIPASAREQLFAATALLVVSAILYFGRTLLIPMLLAVLLSFVLTPFVIWLQRRGVHRILSVGIVMTVALVGIGCLFLAVYSQVNALALELPSQKEFIIEKIRTLTGTGPSGLATLSKLVDEINQQVQDQGQKKDEAGGKEEKKEEGKLTDKDKAEETKKVPVAVQSLPPSWLNLSSLASSVGYVLGFITLTIGLCGSMLIRREDLRNRLISLIGQGNVTSTTRAMEEVNQRISRYMVGHVVLNAAFGILFGVGLMIFGVKYSLLWGLLASVLRFIPGLGTWMAAVIPVVISLATPGWWQPISVLALTAVLGIVFNYVVEPIVFSRRTGLSIVSLVIMAAFWTWLWGLPGLVLATPVSVCLLVLGSHIPMFHFLYVLLAEESAIDADLGFYQRLLANDEDEATSLLENYLLEHTREEMCQEVIIPTLVHGQSDVVNQLISAEEMTRMTDIIKRLVEQVMIPIDSEAPPEANSPASKTILLGCASHDSREELALSLMGYLLPAEAGRLEIISDRATVSEIVQKVRELSPAVVCIVSMPPRGMAQPRMRCKRLRMAFPELPIMIGVWGIEHEEEKDAALFKDVGATQVTWSMEETMDAVVPLLRVATHRGEEGGK